MQVARFDRCSRRIASLPRRGVREEALSRHLGIVWVTFLVACSGSVPSGPSRDAGPRRDGGFATSSTKAFSLMTWNLENFPKTPQTSTVVSALLDELAPDLVGVQEIDDEATFRFFLTQHPDYDGSWVRGEQRIAVGYMYRVDRLRVSNVESLFRTDRSAFPRSPIQAFVEVLGPDGEVRFDFNFITVHLKAQVDFDSQERRRDAIEKLDDYLTTQLATGGEQDWIVVGDYNDRLTDSGARNVFTRMLDQPDKYTFLTRGLEEGGAYSYIPIPGFIDHILVTNDALGEYGAGKTEVLELERTQEGYVALVSDHRPVRAIFELP
ncbi:MAG: endonuclease/exonuclease/phosphatase family protein [Deltaproteobacteria bacterium]|jgi:exonuclease III